MSSPVQGKPTKRQLQTPPYGSEEEDERPVKEELPSSKKKPKVTPKKKSVRKSSPRSASSTPKKAAKPWPGHEILKLLELVNPKPTGILWADIARQMDGRDEKSCHNKYARIQPKLREAILALGS